MVVGQEEEELELSNGRFCELFEEVVKDETIWMVMEAVVKQIPNL